MDKISISAAGPDKFYWMRMNDKGRTVTALDGSKIKIEAKALFGVREVRGKEYDEILLVTGERFNRLVHVNQNVVFAFLFGNHNAVLGRVYHAL